MPIAAYADSPMATSDAFDVSVSQTATAAKATIAARAIQTCAESERSGLSGKATLRPKIEAAVSSSSEPGTSASRQTVPASRPTAQGGY